MNKKGPFFIKNTNDEYSVNFDACKYAKGLDYFVREGSNLRLHSETNWDLTKVKDLHIFYTIDDPVVAPSSKTAEDYVAYSVEGTLHSYTLLGGLILRCKTSIFEALFEFWSLKSRYQPYLLESGHLCCLPYVPSCDRSFMGFGDHKFMLEWSRNTTPERKEVEASEYEKFYKSVVHLLNNHFQWFIGPVVTSSN